MEGNDIKNQLITCENCGNHFTGNYCNQCGQTAHSGRIDFNFVLHQIQSSVFKFDHGIFYNIRKFFIRPGYSIREYLEGKRIHFMKPFTFLLFLSIIYFLISKILPLETPFEEFVSGFREGLLETNEKLSTAAVDWMIVNYAYAILIMVPLFSFSSAFVFYKAKLNLFEHLVINTFTFGQITFYFIIFFPLRFFVSQDFYSAVSLIIGLLFLIITYYQVFKKSKLFYLILNIIICLILFMLFLLIFMSVLVAVSTIFNRL